MLWLNKHPRLRNNLSPYVDGRLTASETTVLEAHIALCEACRRELDELRATASALRGLPQAEAPRSFAITPGMLERRAMAAARPTPALGAGMRLAGAAVAAALAVVLVGDLTIGGGGGASREAGSQPAEESRLAQIPGATDTSKSGESGAYAQPSGNADSSTTQSNTRAAEPCAPAGVPPATGGAGSAGGAGTTAGRGSGETPAATTTPQPVATPSPQPPSTAPDLAAICGDASGAVVAPVAPVTPSPSAANAQGRTDADEATTRAASEVNEDHGTSTLRVAEIVLAATLVAILAAIIFEAALRRRRVA
jgi:hypothetical protein